MIAQQLFGTSALHLLTQNAKSVGIVNGAQSCQLHSKDGRRCAIGCLIPRDLYSSTLEGSSILDILAAAGGSTKFSDMEVQLTNRQAVYFSGWLGQEDLLYELQCTHDAFEVEEWTERLQRIAKKYSLHFETVSQI